MISEGNGGGSSGGNSDGRDGSGGGGNDASGGSPPSPQPPPFNDPIIGALFATCYASSSDQTGGNITCSSEAVNQYARSVEEAYNLNKDISKATYEILELDEIRVMDINQQVLKEALEIIKHIVAEEMFRGTRMLPLTPFPQPDTVATKKAAKHDSDYVKSLKYAAAHTPPVHMVQASGGGISFNSSSSYNKLVSINAGASFAH